MKFCLIIFFCVLTCMCNPIIAQNLSGEYSFSTGFGGETLFLEKDGSFVSRQWNHQDMQDVRMNGRYEVIGDTIILKTTGCFPADWKEYFKLQVFCFTDSTRSDDSVYITFLNSFDFPVNDIYVNSHSEFPGVQILNLNGYEKKEYKLLSFNNFYISVNVGTQFLEIFCNENSIGILFSRREEFPCFENRFILKKGHLQSLSSKNVYVLKN